MGNRSTTLLGTNGAGKSTLLRAVTGLGFPYRGVVRFRGDDVTYKEPVGTDLDALHGPDARTLLRNALRVAAGGAPPACEVTGPGVIDVNVWHQKGSTTVHLVNLTNPNLYGGPFDELVEVGSPTVRLGLDPGRDVEQVRLLRAGTTARFDRGPDGMLTVQVPAISDFEIVAIEGAR